LFGDVVGGLDPALNEGGFWFQFLIQDRMLLGGVPERA
jgi:hypothetical protein